MAQDHPLGKTPNQRREIPSQGFVGGQRDGLAYSTAEKTRDTNVKATEITYLANLER